MIQVKSFLRVEETGILVSKTNRVKTSNCFKRRFVYSEFFKKITSHSPATEGGLAVCSVITEDGHTFMEMAHELLSLKTPQDQFSVSKLLIAEKKTFSLKQVDELQERFAAGETGIGLIANNRYANFFFIHDDEGHVFVVIMYEHISEINWMVRMSEISDNRKWRSGYRLFSREPKKDI